MHEAEGRRARPVPARTRRTTGTGCVLLAAGLATALLASRTPLNALQLPAPPPLAPGPSPAAKDRAEALEAEAERLARESRTLLGELRRLEVERAAQVERGRLAASAVSAAARDLEAASARLADLETQRAVLLPDIAARLVDMYKRGPGGNLRLLLGTSSVREFARAMRATSAVAAMTERRLGEHQFLTDAARKEREARLATVERLQAEQRAVQAAQRDAERAVAARAALLADIDRQRDLTAQLAGELEVAARRLNQQVTEVAAAPPPSSALAPVFPPRLPVRGGLEWPLAGRVIGRFGDTSIRTPGGSPRNGIEIEAPEGAPVQAIHAGTVVFADGLAGFGTLVIIDHGSGFHSVYAYLAGTALSKGDAVDVGREVGRVGPGTAGPPAAYFEFRIDGRSVDPLQWLRQR